MNTLLDRITIDPNVCFGKPCIKGTRIWVLRIFVATYGALDTSQLMATR